jgi:multidrug efflux pump subunit AcrA (membrane-fusion protein)
MKTLQWEVTIFLSVAMVCLTVLLALHIVPWPWLVGAGVTVFAWVSRSPFATPLEKILEKKLGDLLAGPSVMTAEIKPVPSAVAAIASISPPPPPPDKAP